MDLVLPMSGNYVVAVSGGVDSVVLLHRLMQLNAERRAASDGAKPLRLVVAHYDHGIRENSADDKVFVEELAKGYGVPFVHDSGQLGAGASEADARTARYGFLRKVRRASGAQALITAHHQDDALETAIFNLMRGTGRKGLTALSSHPAIIRPLLSVPKRDIIAYARDQGLRWSEDSTNRNQRYTRNYIRHTLLSRFSDQDRQRLWEILARLRSVNHELDSLLINQLHQQSVGGALDRVWFNHLPHAVAREVMATWLRAHDVRGFDSKALERLVVAAKVSQSGKRIDVAQGVVLLVGDDVLALTEPER